MTNTLLGLLRRQRCRLLPALCGAMLAACGAGPDAAGGSSAAATTAATLSLDVPAHQAASATEAVQPTFHLAPVLLDEPDDMDAVAADNSALFGPHTTTVPEALSGLDTRELTRAAIESAASASPSAQRRSALLARGAKPLASGTVVATYTPAQIRAAYGLPALPAAGSVPSAAQAAGLGAGQTVYVIAAMHNPNVAAELAAFNQKFGLPGCTDVAIAPNATLPLAAAPKDRCVLSVVYSTAAGAMTAAAPAYDATWSTEISLDVQWAHAIAPLARIVLIEAPDASVDSLAAAVRLANAMGRGVVSMSFGAPEGRWGATLDGAFAGADMSYVAATGDSGAAVNWPAVSTRVLAIGGTSLSYGSGQARSETAWSSTGGGASAYTASPSYQSASVPGMGSATARRVADVSFNADPTTGQYVAVISPGNSTVGWVSAGGTSLSAPQWAGVLAIANALRARASQPPLARPHALLYGAVAGSTANYSAAFADIRTGANGTCAGCTAAAGYDIPTGLGTPHAAALLPLLTGAPSTPVAPVVAAGAINGTAGVPLSFAASVNAANPLSYSLSGAPSGMGVSAAGVISWTAPVAGNYSVKLTAVDTVTGLSGEGVYSIAIAAPTPPQVTAATVSGTAGVAWSHQVGIVARNPVSLGATGMPSGMSLAASGILSWANPRQGTYSVTLTATDTRTGLSGQAVVKLTVGAPRAPVVTGASVSGRVGAALSFAVAVQSANPVNYSLSGAPAGMSISGAGVVSWPAPVAGNYAVTVSATDPKTGLVGRGVYKVGIAVPGPVITAAPINGVAGRAVSGRIVISAPGATSLSVTITGVPAGMSFAVSGLSITATWPVPVTGRYTLVVAVTDSAGLSAKASVPVTITAR
jgi:hypothetical protein